MVADISFFTSLCSGGGGTSIHNSELLSFLKDYAEKSTGALLCSQWLDSIRDRNDVTADLTARLSDAGHDYDKDKATAASKLKEQMMDDSVQLDAEDNAYINSLDPKIQQEVRMMIENMWKEHRASLVAQLQQGAGLEDIQAGNVNPEDNPAYQMVQSGAFPTQSPAFSVSAPVMPNNVSDVEY